MAHAHTHNFGPCQFDLKFVRILSDDRLLRPRLAKVATVARGLITLVDVGQSLLALQLALLVPAATLALTHKKFESPAEQTQRSAEASKLAYAWHVPRGMRGLQIKVYI